MQHRGYLYRGLCRLRHRWSSDVNLAWPTSFDVTDPAKRERAALDVLALLPEWAVGPTSYDPGT